MSTRTLVTTLGVIAGVALLASTTARAFDTTPQTPVSFDSTLFQSLSWRNIGPPRGGRTKAASGVPSQPHTFYVGVANGGVWKTTDAGRTWQPIFDDQPTGSVGALAVAESDPNIIYVGSGEGMPRPDLSTGDGMYKSTDAGNTWTHLGLRDAQQIPRIVVDPENPDRVFVAVLGHPYGPSTERGIFRSTDGGLTFDRVLYKDENTGGVDLALDPVDPNTIYAVMWETRQGPWENAVWNGAHSGLFKSTDGGTTWHPLTQGLPTFAEGLGRIGVTVAPSNPRRLYAAVDAGRNGGIFRSDDAGETWTLANNDSRVVGRPADAADIRVHPTNPDIVFVPSIVAWKSTDGGRTFTGWRGAPGGDDYQRMWINPTMPDVILMTADQGALVTLNGGDTWSSWYNQSTAQFYHVSTDNAFPYRVCGGQQESGSACVASRGDDGQITSRDWHPVGVEEYGYVAPDPLNPDIVYGGKVTRYDRRTGQVQSVAPPRDAEYRTVRTAPLLFSPLDSRTLFFASNTLWKTTTGGHTWTQISPDLTRATWDVPASVGAYRDRPNSRPSQRGVIYTIGPSYVDINTIWVGSDDGLIHVTRDAGQTWTDVTPPALSAWEKVSLIEASHFDVNTAYAAINTLRLDDLRPQMYRTRDAGKTWVPIVAGLPDGATINAVREDPVRRGLLFAGSELNVSVSFDDGDSWRPLRLNMPATSIRDLVIKDDDLVVGTHGRGFWILDDITPLRQVTPAVVQSAAYLFRPPVAWRFKWNKYSDTPPPPDEPSQPNPVDGITISYYLSPASSGPVTLEITNTDGTVIRRYSSDEPDEVPVSAPNHPDYWIRPTQKLLATPGLHRFVWDVRYAPPAVTSFSYPISAVPWNTPKSPQGVWTMPGQYQVRLTAGGRTYRQPIQVKLDPRVQTPIADLSLQFKLSMAIDVALRQLAAAREGATAERAAAIAAAYRPLPGLLADLQRADVRPTVATEAAVAAALAEVSRTLFLAPAGVHPTS
ncbi:MAG: glycoside hydrolase [Acidobacteria bacterium]|nr:glycoside hydrolase [Acidobacteriota bacterium]